MNNMVNKLLVKESVEGTIIIHIEEAFGGKLRTRRSVAQGDARGEHRLAVITTNHCQGWMVICLFHICSVFCLLHNNFLTVHDIQTLRGLVDALTVEVIDRSGSKYFTIHFYLFT